MSFNVNNFVIDHPLRGIMLNTSTGKEMWSINQISNPKLTVTSDTAEAKDALGTTIATFNRGKKAEFSAENSLFDLGLYAAQNGVEKQVASASVTIETPAFETLTVVDVATAVVLAHVPTASPAYIYKLNGDGTLSTASILAASAAAGKFAYDTSKHAITFPTDASKGDEYFVTYNYNADSAVAVTGDAINFPKAGRFVLEILGTDTCDPTTLIHAYIVFPNAKLDANVDMTFTTDGTHPFTIQAQQAYCDSKKTLYQIVIPEEQ